MAKHQQEAEPALDQQNPTFLFDVLYCSEEILEGEVKEEERLDCFEEADDINCHTINENKTPNNKQRMNYFPLLLLEQDLNWEDEELSSLFAREEENPLYNTLQSNPSLALALPRGDAVEWILKVNAHYSFAPLTAVLAVNFLDRFLFTLHLETDKPWMTQLAAVACLSLAAKVEETKVPLLLDLQVEDCKYVFEAKTIQRMEILVLSALNWRMNPVTPLSFLDYITRRLGLKDHLCWEFIKRCERIVLSIISDGRCMQYVPSVVATATMVQVINCIEPCLGVEYQTQLLGILGMDKEQNKVKDCSKVVQQLVPSKGHHRCLLNKRKFIGSIPGSPNGVMDVSFSSENSNDSWATVASMSVSSSPEPLSKKNGTPTVQSLSRAPAQDFVSIPDP